MKRAGKVKGQRRASAQLGKEQRAFLRGRLEALAAKRPAARDLERELLAISGAAVVFHRASSAHLERVASDGRLWRLRRVRVPGGPSECHLNSAAEWWRSSGRSRLAHGWALSADGLWREHSWCMRDGRILETTPSYRRRYFGIILDGRDAFIFAGSAGLPAVERLVARNQELPRWLRKVIGK